MAWLGFGLSARRGSIAREFFKTVESGAGASAVKERCLEVMRCDSTQLDELNWKQQNV
jgi:hypothetical protein